MKYNRIFIGAAICFGIVHSCQEPEQEIALDGSKVVFVASVEETRVSISDDYRTLSWSAGDEISVLDGTSNVLYSTSDGGTSVKFTSQAGISDEAGEVYAVYPYDAESRLTENGLQVTVPHQQSVADSGFDASSVLAIAYSSELSSETYLDFKHLCSYFKFTVPSEDNVTEVILRGGEKEYIAGKVNVTFEKGVPVCSVVDGINEIVFRSETPMNGTYIVPLLPCVLQEGLAVTLKSKDGRSAVHKVIAKDETGLESAVTFLRGKMNKAVLSFDQPQWRNAPVASAVASEATSVTVKWSENDFSSADADFACRYRVALYSDEACSEAVVESDFKVESWTNISCPAVCFTGLQAEKDYWFVVTDIEAESSCQPLKVTTAADDFVTVGQNASEGQVILKENFSELSAGGDPVNVAWGLGEDGLMEPKDLVNWNTVDMSAMRLASWSEKSEGHNYAGPGYIRVGDSSSQKDAVLTPVLSSLGACASVEVSFKAAPYSSDYGVTGASRLGECYAEVWVVTDDTWISAGVVELNDTPDAWTSCSLTAVNVLPGSRIAVGGAYGAKTVASGGKQYSRIYVDDIAVKLLRYEETVAVIPPEVEVKKAFWSDAFIEWTCAGDAKGYKVYVDDDMVAELGADASEYHIKGLECGKTYNVAVAAMYNSSDEGLSRPATLTTGTISQITRNVSPTSLSVSIENRAGTNSNNNNPCLYVELLDSDYMQTATKVYSTYVLDAQIQSPASPFMASLVVNEKKGRAPLNVAFGCLEPGKDYWFRVRSVKRWEGTTYQPSTPAITYCESSNGDSEFSPLVKVSTAKSHVPASDEILYQGFDDLMVQADYVNCAVGSMPAFKAEGKKNTDMSYETIKNWTGGWSFYGLRTAFGSTQLAAHYAWATQQTKSDAVFALSKEDANGTIKGTAPGVGAKVYKFKETSGSLAGWYSSNNTFACQGYIELGAYYSSGDSKAQTLGMIATPALDSQLLGMEATSCRLSFRGLVLQGKSCTLGIWVYDQAAGTWSNVENIKLKNSAGSESAVEVWDGTAATHRWYDHECTLNLKKGDIVAFSTDKQGAALIDEIIITTK